MIGFCIGVITGVLLMSMLSISKKADDFAEYQHKERVRCKNCKWYEDRFCACPESEVED